MPRPASAPRATPYHSYKTGPLARGCQLCVQGKKLVLFITGRCGQRCFYCPVSEGKFGKDVVYANEWQVEDPEAPHELLEEARLTGAEGAGITGGDPLVDVERCGRYIRLLKREFGKQFHIHLYTPLLLVTPARLRNLHAAGLDEIRFHLGIKDKRLWPRLALARARKLTWSVGVEIPCIPGHEQETREMIDFIAKLPQRVDFLNLNELELSDTQVAHYRLAGAFRPKDSSSYGAAGSVEQGKRLLRYARRKGLPAHLCTARLKDAVQMRTRLRRRAKGVAREFDTRTSAGTLIRGAVYLPRTRPGIGYRAMLAKLQADPVVRGHLVRQLVSMRARLLERGGPAAKLAPACLVVDERKLRLLLSAKDVRRLARALKALHLVPAIVEEYPTQDGLEAEIDFL